MIQCEILVPSGGPGRELRNIARTCAIDLQLAVPLSIEERSSRSASGSQITLTIPADIAIACETVWKLASRIACFCPSARVSAQILGYDAAAETTA